MWILFYRRFADSTRPTTQKHGPECSNAWQDQQPEANAGSLSLRIKPLEAEGYKTHGEHESETGVCGQRVDEGLRQSFRHRCRKPESPHR